MRYRYDCGHPYDCNSAQRKWNVRVMATVARKRAACGWRLIGCAALAFVALEGCGESVGSASQYTVHDSAGVTIVETGLARGGAPRVSAEPLLRIGQVDGDPHFEFSDIAGVVRTVDGSIVVADRQAFALRYFDSSGNYLREAGTRGEGPGEFSQNFLAVHECGKGMIIVREWNGIASWWSMEGRYAGPAKYQLPPSHNQSSRSMAGIATPLYSACSPSGRIVMTSWGDPARQPARAEMKPGTAVSYATWSRIWIMDTSGAVLTEFPDTIIAERIQHLSSGGGGGSGPHMFGRNVSFVMDSSHLIMSYGDRLELSHYSFDGKLRAIWRALADDLELTEAMVKQYESAKLAPADSEERAYYLPRFTLTYPSTYPAFDKLFLTPSGYVWARRFRLPWEEGYRWGVFEPEGRFLGYTELPRGLEVFQIDDDYVTGVAKDSLDVPFVQLHEVALRGSR